MQNARCQPVDGGVTTLLVQTDIFCPTNCNYVFTTTSNFSVLDWSIKIRSNAEVRFRNIGLTLWSQYFRSISNITAFSLANISKFLQYIGTISILILNSHVSFLAKRSNQVICSSSHDYISTSIHDTALATTAPRGLWPQMHHDQHYLFQYAHVDVCIFSASWPQLPFDLTRIIWPEDYSRSSVDVGYLVWTDVSRARTEKFPSIHIVRPPLIELVEARGFLVYCKRCQLSLHQFHSVLKYNRSQTVWVVYFISWVFSENLFLSYAVCGRSWLLLLFFASSLRVFFLFSRPRFAAQRISYFFFVFHRVRPIKGLHFFVGRNRPSWE